MFVEQKRWMTAEEFNEAYALCQFLPGPEHRQSHGGVRFAHARRRPARSRPGRGFLLLPFST